jgi:hypothetical protein
MEPPLSADQRGSLDTGSAQLGYPADQARVISVAGWLCPVRDVLIMSD